MTDTYKKNNSKMSTAALISAITAIVAVIISPITTYFITTKQTKMNVYVNERKEWIDTLRNEVSTFLSVINKFNVKCMDISSATSTVDLDSIFMPMLHEMFFLKIKIALMLDKDNEIHKRLDYEVHHAGLNSSNYMKEELKKTNFVEARLKELEGSMDKVFDACQTVIKYEMNKIQ